MFDLDYGSKILQILPTPIGMFALMGLPGDQVKIPVVYSALIETEDGATYMENICITNFGEYKFLSNYQPITYVHLPSHRAMAEYQSPPSMLK